MWRFHELLPFAPQSRLVTVGEGQTLLQQTDAVGQYVGLNAGMLHLQYEGMNPSGSFKDNGMCAAFTHAHLMGPSVQRVPAPATPAHRWRFIAAQPS